MNDEITVHFDWEEDRSVGIWGHWENCYAELQAGLISTVFAFSPVEDKPVDEWPLEQVTVCSHNASRLSWPVPEAAERGVKMRHWNKMVFASVDEPTTYTYHEEGWIAAERPMILCDFPEIAQAVEEEWAAMQRSQREYDEAEARFYEEMAESAAEWEDRS